MSREYDLYLEQHRGNVAKAYYWIEQNLPELLIEIPDVHYEHQICFDHDTSKNQPDEYHAYDKYFYGGNRSYHVVEAFNYAWLKHIHRNPHHWQHFVLVHDEPGEGITVLDMPYPAIIEMICDWFAFSFNTGELREIFKWYDKHKDYMKLSDNTRKTVERILRDIDKKLDELEANNE